MNFDELTQVEQALIGKQQLLIKSQLAQSNNSAIIAKQQLAVKAGLAKAKAAQQSAV